MGNSIRDIISNRDGFVFSSQSPFNHYTSPRKNFLKNEVSFKNIETRILSNPENTTTQKIINLLKCSVKVIFAPITLIVYLASRFAAYQGLGSERETRKIDEKKRAQLLAKHGETIKFGLEGQPILEGMYFHSNQEQKNAKTILLCTGSHRSYEFYALPMIAALRSMGHHVMVFNYEGFGKSEGTPSEDGVYRSIEAAYQYLKQEKHCEDKSIVAWGYSLGSGAVSDLASKHPLDMVIDRGFSSMSQVAYQTAPQFCQTIAKIIFIMGAYFNNLSKIRKAKGNILIAQGDHDFMMTKAEHGQKLHEAVAKNKKAIFLEVDSGHHHNDAEVWFSKGKEREAIDKFLRQ